MKRVIHWKKIIIYVISSILFPYSAYATVWNGSVTASVTDDNIQITGDVQIDDRVYVTAANQDVLITLSTDVIISSSLQLHFYSVDGNDITVDLSVNPYNLAFQGLTGLNFLITFSTDGNGGQLTFNLGDGQTVSFQANPVGGGAAQFFIMMNSLGAPQVNVVTTGSTTFSYFRVSGGALISYLAATGVGANDTGNLFMSAPAGAAVDGGLIFAIGANGGFTIDGNAVSNVIAPSFSDIDFTDNLGLPQFSLESVMIQNSNNVYPRLKIDPFCEGDNNPYTGIRPGFVLSANGSLIVTQSTYFDYVVTATNVTPSVVITPSILQGDLPTSLYKDRNAAALIVDGDPTHTSTAQIILADPAAIYFRSGVDKDGVSTFTVDDGVSTVISYTIDPENDFDNQGSFVFDVEGVVDVHGTADNSVLNILSIYVEPTGGSVLIEGSETNFPLRTYQKDAAGNYLQYARAAFMVNNRLNFINAQLQHTDEIHTQETQYPRETSLAPLPTKYAPTYVGGESRNFAARGCTQEALENTMAFYGQAGTIPAYGTANAGFLFHTSGALTGVDTLFSGGGDESISRGMIFYYNGRCIDNGGGREVVFGTNNSCVASDFATIINRDAHFNIIPDDPTAAAAQTLGLYTLPNNDKVTEDLTTDVTGQFGVQTIYLGNDSNISVGVNADIVMPDTNISTLTLYGSYFAFWSEGGTLKQPEMSMTTGEGGIFVDQNGIFQTDPANQLLRASFGAMVTKSRNAIVTLPSNAIFFAPRMGLADWKLTFTIPAERIIVPAGATFGDYTFDWANLRKDYCGSDVNVPYELPATLPAASYPAVTTANLTGLPIVYGSVDQLQVINSRLGDQAQMIISGSANGIVRETVFLNSGEPGTCPTAFIVVQDDAILGLGTASRNVDSLDASVVLGVNGVTLVANGNATVRLNCNTLINNVCHILSGTLFGATAPQELVIDSAVPTELRVKSTGVLDLTQFTQTNQQITIGGQVHLVLEPGAQVLLGGGSLFFTDQASLECTPYIDNDSPTGTTTASTDIFRVKFIGSGRVTFKEGSQMLLPRGALLGIETDPLLSLSTTNQSWLVTDEAQLLIGSSELYGGGFQVGNVVDNVSNVVSFALTLDGQGAQINIDTQGFLGFAVGIVDKPELAPNSWRVANLYNVAAINLNLTQGTFRHQQILPGTDRNASLFALGAVATGYTLTGVPTPVSNAVNLTLLGGGNMIVVVDVPGETEFINPTVTTVNGSVGADTIVGILSSRPTLLDYSKVSTVPVGAVPATTLLTYLSMNPYAAQYGRTAALFRSALGQVTYGYINGTTIVRGPANYLKGLSGVQVPYTNALAVGAAGLAVAASGAVSLSELNP